MSEITDLQAAEAAINTAVSNAVAELQTLSAQISSNTNDPAAMEAAAAAINTLATNLQAAVTAAQTPPAPAPTPPASS